jgi:ribosomal protein S1
MPEEKKATAPVVPTFTIDPSNPMSRLVDQIATPPAAGDTVEGTIIELVRGKLYVDLPPFGTGIIYGREYLNAADVLRKSNPGDLITAKVVDPSGLEGYIELSLKEARQAAIWGEAETAIVSGTVYNLTVGEANKGGLILTWQGIQGFLPASQLSKDHYPRVPEGDKDKIFGELQKAKYCLSVSLPQTQRRINSFSQSALVLKKKRKETLSTSMSLATLLKVKLPALLTSVYS